MIGDSSGGVHQLNVAGVERTHGRHECLAAGKGGVEFANLTHGLKQLHRLNLLIWPAGAESDTPRP